MPESSPITRPTSSTSPGISTSGFVPSRCGISAPKRASISGSAWARPFRMRPAEERLAEPGEAVVAVVAGAKPERAEGVGDGRRIPPHDRRHELHDTVAEARGQLLHEAEV